MYCTSLEHLNDELLRIRQMVIAYYRDWKQHSSSADRDLLGLYISDDEVEGVIARSSAHAAPQRDDADKSLRDLEKRIQTSREESLKNGTELRLVTLERRFGLSQEETDIFLLALMPELDLRYEKLYAYLQDDVTRRRPTADLALNVLFPNPEQRLSGRGLFSAGRPLMKNRLLRFARNDPEGQVPLLSRELNVDERIIGYLLGSDDVDDHLAGAAELLGPDRPFSEFLTDDNGIGELRQAILCTVRQGAHVIVYIHGPYGTGRRMFVEAVCTDLGKKLLVIDSRFLAGDSSRDRLGMVLREARLQGSWLLLEQFGQVLAPDAGTDPISFFRELDSFSGGIFISANRSYELPSAIDRHVVLHHEFRYPPYELRKMHWTRLLDRAGSGDADTDLLAAGFRFSAGQIEDAICSAWRIARARHPASPVLTMDDLNRGCRAQSNRNLAEFARKIHPVYHWDDIVLPADTRAQLHEICDYIRFRGRVYSEWGFKRKMSLGRGLNILFSGPSGTGKTMAAEVIASEAGLDLYKIDLSSVVSKYIGETEKNLNNIFREAESSNAILFFDEADALFGKRSEVRDAHDRYANIEINYLLQKMEESEGVVILASNFPKNIDDAFRRRMHFAVEFSQPGQEERMQIWRQVFPKETPLAGTIDYPFLAGFKITGGNIRNIALNAAFLAAADSGTITMQHLAQAMRREFQKTGKLCVREEFGAYYPMIEGDTS